MAAATTVLVAETSSLSMPGWGITPPAMQHQSEWENVISIYPAAEATSNLALIGDRVVFPAAQ